MNENEINNLMAEIFRKKNPATPPPTSDDWIKLENYFSTSFPEEFESFMNLAGKYYIEGELLLVSVAGELIGDDTIVSAVIAERNVGDWPENLIPFFSVGNGDYYCITKGTNPSVVYIYHEDRSIQQLHDTFEAFLRNELVEFA